MDHRRQVIHPQYSSGPLKYWHPSFVPTFVPVLIFGGGPPRQFVTPGPNRPVPGLTGLRRQRLPHKRRHPAMRWCHPVPNHPDRNRHPTDGDKRVISRNACAKRPPFLSVFKIFGSNPRPPEYIPPVACSTFKRNIARLPAPYAPAKNIFYIVSKETKRKQNNLRRTGWITAFRIFRHHPGHAANPAQLIFSTSPQETCHRYF